MGAKWQAASKAREAAIGFLGPWAMEIVRAQTRLDMDHRDFLIEGCQRRREGGGGVAMYQHHVWTTLRQNPAHAQEYAA